MASLLRRIRAWFSREPMPERCLQCGLPPGRQFLVTTDEPIMYPHQCSWCQSILYVPGPVFACKGCSREQSQAPAA